MHVVEYVHYNALHFSILRLSGKRKYGMNNTRILCIPSILQEFGGFLRQKEQYDYIIDAANVAYQNQNYKDGKFKYEQVSFLACLVIYRTVMSF